MFIELTALDGDKVLVNTDNITVICKSYNGDTGAWNTQVWSVGDTEDLRGIIVQESYEEVKSLINS